MSNRDKHPLPKYAVDLLVQAKTMLRSMGTEHQYRAFFQLQDAVIRFEEKMPLLPDGSISESN